VAVAVGELVPVPTEAGDGQGGQERHGHWGPKQSTRLRGCQVDAFAALGNYLSKGGRNAAFVMSVGAGKTALGVVAILAFTRQRALVVTPGSVIRGTFDRAFDHQAVGNALYGLPKGPLIPGCRPPTVLTLDRDEGAIRSVTREQLLAADVIITNFHSLGIGEDGDDLLAKLRSSDIDLIVVDEAHIAAAESYQRLFRHFADATTILMSACFQRLDGKPIDADVVYRYRLIDSIVDGNAKNLRVQRFAPDATQTLYEMVWSDGSRQEIRGRDAILDLLKDERKLSAITAKSHEPIRQVMRSVRAVLDQQRDLLYPVKPRVLFSALGERHAEQIARIAEEHGIPCAYLHHSMTDSRIQAIRARFEQESGDLQGIVQLKMLGQGYDFPPITVVVPMRPYGSFSDFYQFVGRGIRVLTHSSASWSGTAQGSVS
jgi:superfamily II DNA or RNA helicase